MQNFKPAQKSVGATAKAEPSLTKEPRWARPSTTSKYLCVSPATLWRWNSQFENFPKPHKHGPRVTCWDLNEIDAWCARQTRSAGAL
jgi:predicted DNA-binding transcriptional regulator AlpA